MKDKEILCILIEYLKCNYKKARKYFKNVLVCHIKLRAFVDKVYIHEKEIIDGHYRQSIEIIYYFVGAVEIPDFD